MTTPTQALHTTQTHVRNTSGMPMVFGYLGANGVSLASNEDYWQPGDLRRTLAAQHDQTRYRSLIADLNTGRLTILAEPAVVISDIGTGEVVALEANSGELGFNDPNWLPAPSSAFEDGSD